MALKLKQSRGRTARSPATFAPYLSSLVELGLAQVYKNVSAKSPRGESNFRCLQCILEESLLLFTNTPKWCNMKYV